jgi:hypothetical protein
VSWKLDGVAAVSSAVADDDATQRERPAIARQSVLGRGAADELAEEPRERKRGEREHDERTGLRRRVGKRDERDQYDSGEGDRRAEEPQRPAGADLSPGEERPDPREQHDQNRQRRHVAVEPGGGQGRALAGHRLRDEREESAVKDDEGEPDQKHVVDQEHRLSRRHRLDPALCSQIAQARDDQRGRAGQDERDEDEERRADRRLAKSVDRLEDPGANQERAEKRERERHTDERDVPDLEHPAALLHHDRVKERRADKPWHE